MLPALDEAQLLEAMGHDKKSTAKGITVILLKQIGECFLYPTTTAYFQGMME